ncbi:hypothetical protein [Rhizobium sp. 18055]|uniref:hypothetical protein n=1 Tax=Rhizobium sp. 18055 TaxID=2681403 RepID=UPI00135B2931|nr:hypothetical protein [Rhizobium sp. 18055]
MTTSSQAVSEQNYAKLLEYIERLRRAKLRFPEHGGKVNKTAVATACGFNRETFAQNARFERALNEGVDELGLQPREAMESAPQDAAIKARITQLEQQLAAVRSENYELRRRLAQYDHMTLTGRRVIP